MNKRTAALYGALVAIAFASPATTRASAQDVGNSNADAKAADRARRAVEVKEESSGVGISSGLVVAYGHPLHQPYHFEYRSNLLFVNGVQVEPTVVMQRDSDKTRHDMTADDTSRFSQLQELARKVRSVYFDKLGKVPSDQLRAEVLGLVRAHPLIKDAEWTNDTMIVYHQKGAYEAVSTGISFAPRSLRADAKPKKSTEAMKSEHLAELEAHLRKGGCLFFGSIGAWRGYGRQCGDIKKRIVEVMRDAKLSDSEKELKIKDTFNGSLEHAKDIQSNFSDSEWK